MQLNRIINKPLGASKDYTDQTLHFLTAIEYLGRVGHGQTVWRWECTRCGNTIINRACDVESGHTKSCGCWNGFQHRTHGKTKTPEFKTWQAIRDRCRPGVHPTAAHYGNRGIVVCQRWRDSFEAFFEDMGERPFGDYSIDRVNNEGNYSCGQCAECGQNNWSANCRWATSTEQNRNTRATKFITHNGETLCHAEWSLRLSSSRILVNQRLRNGWSAEDAVTIPVGSRSRWSRRA